MTDAYTAALAKASKAAERKQRRAEKAKTLWKDKPKNEKRKYVKKSKFVRLRNQLDQECQAYAVERDKEIGCRIRKAAQCTGNSEVGYHLLPRGKWAVRWDLDFMGIGNIVGACNACNAGERWHRLDYADRHRELFGDDFYEALWEKSREPYHFTSMDLERILIGVRARRKALKGE